MAKILKAALNNQIKIKQLIALKVAGTVTISIDVVQRSCEDFDHLLLSDSTPASPLHRRFHR